MPDPRRSAAQRALDAVRAADPGLARGLTTLQALLAAGVAGGVTFGALQLLGASALPAGLAGAVGLFGVVTLPPGPPRPWAPAAAGAAAAGGVGAALLGAGPAGFALALAVTVCAAWAGRWGPTGRSAGFLGFLVNLLALRIGLVPSDVPGMVLGACVGVGGVLLVTGVLLADRPRPRARRLARALLAALSRLVDAAERLAAEGPGRRRERRMRLRLVAVQETALLLDRALDELAPADPEGADGAGAGPVAALRRSVLDVEALADHLVWAVLTIPDGTGPEEREALAATLHRGRVESDDPDLADAPLVPRLQGSDDRMEQVVTRLAAAARTLRRTDGLPAAPPARAPGVGATVPVRRVVVQTALAVTASLLLGLLVAPQEWYWAVIGAYVVVTTTSSRGAGVRKALERLLGTAVGVAAGLGIAALLAGSSTVVLAVLLGAVAVMVWVFRVNYALFMFVLTIAVALLYQVTGMLTTELLALRLAETALGAGIAGLVVSFVLPLPTRESVDGAVEGLLEALAGVLASLADDGRLDHDAVRRVDGAVSALREATAPVAGGGRLGVGRDVRAARLLATAVRVRVAALATATSAAPLRGGPEQTALDVLADRLESLRRQLRGDAPTPDGRTPFPRTQSPVGAVLQAIDDRLAGYGTARGISLRGDPGALAAGAGTRRA